MGRSDALSMTVPSPLLPVEKHVRQAQHQHTKRKGSTDPHLRQRCPPPFPLMLHLIGATSAAHSERHSTHVSNAIRWQAETTKQTTQYAVWLLCAQDSRETLHCRPCRAPKSLQDTRPRATRVPLVCRREQRSWILCEEHRFSEWGVQSKRNRFVLCGFAVCELKFSD